MPGIQDIHEAIFDFLRNWSERARRNEINSFFYTRSVRDERFRKGYWFPGNENYLCVSFWKGGDSQNKTPNIYFEVNKKSGCTATIIAKDSQEKYQYFEKLTSFLNEETENKKYVKIRGGWVKNYSKSEVNYISLLQEFIETDKKYIDLFIANNNELLVEEFTQPFGFVEAYDFENMISRVLKEKTIIKEANYQRQLELQSRPQLPIAIESISIENYQGIVNAEINDIPIDSNWIFITGENGYGKTTILQSIALGLNNDPDLIKYLGKKTLIRLGVVFNGTNEYLARSIQSGNVSTDSITYTDYSIGYGPSRLNVQAKTSENIEFKSLSNVLSLFETDVVLKNIDYELFTSGILSTKNFDLLSEAISEVTNGRIFGISLKDTEVHFKERLSNGDQLPPQSLKHLAAGFRNIINLVGDIIVRFSKQKVDTYKDFIGIVLIDEIENHLHPTLQKELPATLSKVFPKIQFIASTHSPIPFLGAPKNSIFLRVDRDLENGVKIQKINLAIDIKNLLPDLILSSPLFGFDDFISSKNENLKDLNTSDSYNEAELIEELKTKFLKIKTS